jgi:hypothetical protein
MFNSTGNVSGSALGVCQNITGRLHSFGGSSRYHLFYLGICFGSLASAAVAGGDSAGSRALLLNEGGPAGLIWKSLSWRQMTAAGGIDKLFALCHRLALESVCKEK